jgi:hypothetical protein
MSDFIFDLKNMKVKPLPDSIIFQRKIIDESCREDIRKQFFENARQFNATICKERDKIMRKNSEVVDVNILVPDKVVEVTFADGTKEKSVCKEPDIFSLESAISICISKKIMGGSSAYNNAVKRGMKAYEDKQKKAAAEKAEQERIEKKCAKRLAYKERRAAKRREEQIAIQAEAYLRAMKSIEDSKNVSKHEGE